MGTVFLRPARIPGRTKTYYAREAIIERLADLEAVYLAERRLECFFKQEVLVVLVLEIGHRREVYKR
jgi:RHH-type rel operon transcriptional repressor/antitoxin RelB